MSKENEEFDSVYTYTIAGRPISQKNSKTIVCRGNRPRMITNNNVRLWKESAIKQLIEQRERSGAPVIPRGVEMEVRIISFLDKGQAIDSDNLAAGPLDAMEKAGIYPNDYWVRCVISDRRKDFNFPRVEIHISKYKET